MFPLLRRIRQERETVPGTVISPPGSLSNDRFDGLGEVDVVPL